MKVALDVNGLYTTQAGSSRYLRGLLTGFRQIDLTGLQIEPLAWKVENFSYRQPLRALKTAYRELVWANLTAPLSLRRSGIDLLHAVDGGLVPPFLCGPQVMTLLDMAIYRYPERFRPWHRRSAAMRHRWLAQARRILCISRFTADEAHQILGIPHARMEVVHLGAEILAETPLPAPQELPELPEAFFLFVGSLEPGKNLKLLRQIYSMAEAGGITLPPLLIVGVRREGVTGEGMSLSSWRFMGWQSDGALKYLYQKATALLFPSIYEGFGFPPLEAMSLGCPVICGEVASLPEVCGSAAAYAGLEPEPYLKVMLRLLRETSWRDDLVARGYAQAAGFRWKNCAEATAQAYREALDG